MTQPLVVDTGVVMGLVVSGDGDVDGGTREVVIIVGVFVGDELPMVPGTDVVAEGDAETGIGRSGWVAVQPATASRTTTATVARPGRRLRTW